MRTIVDKNKIAGLQVAKLTNPRGEILGYNVEDTNLPVGSRGFVIQTVQSLALARMIAEITPNAPTIETKPKTAYPEQQTGYRRPSPKR